MEIILTGLAMGGGILATEALKDAGKDLWRAVKKLILPQTSEPLPPGSIGASVLEQGGGDEIRVSVQVGDVKVTGELKNLGPGREKAVEEFLTVGLPGLLSQALASRVPNSGQLQQPSLPLVFTREAGEWKQREQI